MRAFALAVAILAAPAAAETSLFDATSGMELFPCEFSTLSCTKRTMPLDHRANDPSKTIDITFALSFAAVESRGILFYFVGGPGGSGIGSADSYLSSFDQSMIDYMDIVFVDQRGTGPEHGLTCPVAQAIFEAVDVSINDPEGAKDIARTYVADCTAEMGRDEILPFVTTDQAIRDSEAFRQAIGAPKVWLYGESYGTQFVQGYATQFPNAVRGAIVDGVVDLSLDAEGFYARYTTAAEALLAKTFEGCASIPACASDMQGDAAEAFDALTAELAKGPLTVALPLSDGSTTNRELTLALVEANAFYALYSPEGRAQFLRVLAAAKRGNLVPMLLLGYSNLYVDPETQIGLEDPSWFSAAYYAIVCADYDSGPASTADERADAILADAKAFAPNAPRLLRSYFVERLACAYWPQQGPATRPAPFAGGDYPTLVLNGDGDPITPISMAYSVLDSARNAHGVFMAGGPHVIWGRGFACPDSIVNDLLFEGALPQFREQQCEQDFIVDYAPLTLTDPAELADPMAVARAVDVELYQLIPLANWDGVDPVTMGCDFGGTLTATTTYAGTDYSFKDCHLWPDLAISGTGVEIMVDDRTDGITLTLSVSGRHSGDIVYHYSIYNEAWAISGTWDGQPAVLPRRKP